MVLGVICDRFLQKGRMIGMDIKPYYPCEKFDIETVKRPKGYNMKHLHYHKAYEIYFLEMGQHGYLLNDKFIQIYTQDVVMLKPNVRHKSHNTKSYNRTCVYFTEEFLRSYYTESALKHLLRCFDKEVISLDKENFFKAQNLLEKIRDMYALNDFDRIFIHLGNLLELLNGNMDAPRREPALHTTEKMTPVLSYIAEHYKDITHLDEIAARFYVSTPHLCRVFKQTTGMTVSNYINHVKVQEACELLVHTNKNITEIALECGFNSSIYFCKAFKKQLDCTPSEFRNSTRH